MFEVGNGKVQINGMSNGYDTKDKVNSSQKYATNALNNYYEYLQKPIEGSFGNPAPILDFSPTAEAVQNNVNELETFVNENDKYLKSLPPLEFEYRYMPNIQNGNIDRQALFKTAYEDLGRKDSVEVSEIDSTFNFNGDYTSKPLDINGDGKIDVGEYSSSILAADMLSKSDVPDTNNIDGIINNKGMNKVFEYTKLGNAKAAADLYSKIYSQFDLANASKEFKPE